MKIWLARFAALCAVCWVSSAVAEPGTPPSTVAPPGLEQMLSFPFPEGLVAALHADRIAWIARIRGARNVWTAAGPDFAPRQVTNGARDDGQELTNLVLSPDGGRMVWVRGGDHDSNWEAEGKLQPDPASATDQPRLEIWTAATAGGAARMIAEGDAPALSVTGRLAYVKDGQVWTADLSGHGAPERLFFDRGRAGDLAWSPDGSRLAFVSRRGDHSFVGVFTGKDRPILWMAPGTARDANPVWSPDGTRIAFTRRPGAGGAPEPMLEEVPHPWSIWVADAATGAGRAAWHSPETPRGSYTSVPDGPNLMWAAGDRLTFRAELDGWPHLYSLPLAGGDPVLLTPGAFMVEHVAMSRDRRSLFYSANSGGTDGDGDRRHIFRVPADSARPVAITAGEGLEWTPVAAAAGQVAFISATAGTPPSLHVAGIDGSNQHALGGRPDYPSASLIVPRPVTFQAADGVTVHGQLFVAPGGAARKPGVVFVHGGPPRQMLLGWSYMAYYSNAYAVNQYLASRGFAVLSVNYRLGIGYGRDFHHPAHAGPAGASEYRDVVAGARFLAGLPEVDGDRIGIWGGSYGGYLTALALARDSDIFKAGVDFHGVHDWSRLLAEEETPARRYEKGDWEEAMRVAFESSPVADVARWRSPVLLIHGDDDRNVRINQTIDLARRLDAHSVPYREIVFPNEIHDFLRFQDWLNADAATVNFLEAELRP